MRMSRWAGAPKRCWYTVSAGTPVSRETRTISSISDRLSAVGFSTSTGTPARMAWIANGAWVFGGVHTCTRSIPPAANRSSEVANTWVAPNRSANTRARS